MDNVLQPKSLNQLWKETGENGKRVSFKQWLNEKKREENFSNYDGATTSFPTEPFSTNINNTIQQMRAEGGLVTTISNKTTFGIPNKVLVIGGLIIFAGIIYKLLEKPKMAVAG